jgi:hypothetical protein
MGFCGIFYRNSLSEFFLSFSSGRRGGGGGSGGSSSTTSSSSRPNISFTMTFAEYICGTTMFKIQQNFACRIP